MQNSNSLNDDIDIWQEYVDNKKNPLSNTQEINAHSVVNVAINSCLKVYTFFKSHGAIYKENLSSSTGDYTACLCGSGVIFNVEKDYTYILTNYHVVYNENSVDKNKIFFSACGYVYGREAYPTLTNTYLDESKKYQRYDWGEDGIELEYVGGLATYDLAILKCKTPDILSKNKNIQPIVLDTSHKIGDWVFAIGNPQNEGLSATSGIISVENEYISLAIGGKTRTYRSIRTDSSIYSGSSGGGLFNTSGKLVGITNAGDGDSENINYAIPSQIVSNFIDYFNYDKTNFSPKKLVLGITIKTNPQQIYDSNLNLWLLIDKLLVKSVEKGSVAEKIGLTADDIISKITIDNNSYELTKVYQLSEALMQCHENSPVSLDILREGNAIQLQHTILANDLVTID